jgi:hypothetical protein
MRQLTQVLESLLDTDFDISDSDVIADKIIEKLFDNPDKITGTVENGVLTVSASQLHGDLVLNHLPPAKGGQRLVHTIRAVDCSRLIMYVNTPIKDINFDVPNNLIFIGNTMRFDKVNIKCKHLLFDPSENVKLYLDHTKVSADMIRLDSCGFLQIKDTCKFDDVSLLYFANVDQKMAGKLDALKIVDMYDFKDAQRAWYDNREATDQELMDHWDIDVWKTLGLQANKWPDLGRITASAGGAYGFTLFRRGKCALPLGSTNKFLLDFKDGWSSSIVSDITRELPIDFR